MIQTVMLHDSLVVLLGLSQPGQSLPVLQHSSTPSTDSSQLQQSSIQHTSEVQPVSLNHSKLNSSLSVTVPQHPTPVVGAVSLGVLLSALIKANMAKAWFTLHERSTGKGLWPIGSHLRSYMAMSATVLIPSCCAVSVRVRLAISTADADVA